MNHVTEIATAGAEAAGIPEPLVIGRTPRLRSEPGALPEVQEHVPDTELDGAALPGLVVRAASVRGDAHRYYGTPRQDAMALWHDGNGRLLACVADGLGSKPRSHLGAATACAVAPGNLPHFLAHGEPQTAARCFIENIADGLRARAGDEAEVTPDDLSTTFLTAIVEELTDRPGHRAVIIRVGDCAAWLLHKGRWFPCFGGDGPGTGEEIATPVTRALPRDVEHVEVATADLYPGDMLLLCTDGLARPLQVPEVGARLAAWWSRPEPPSLPEFFWQLSFRARTYDDDRTAVCLWRVAG